MHTLTNRTAVVTGAASGIGRALAEELARRGCRLALCDIDAERLRETEERAARAAPAVSTHVVDVSDRERMQRLPDEIAERHGQVHLLVNNAGVTVLSTVEDHSIEDFQWLFGINFWGVVYGCKFFLPRLLKADEAHIVNVSSVFGLVGVPMQSSYCASKFAVRGFSESLRAELSGTSIGVTSVHPGGIATNITKSSRVAGDERVEAFKKQLSRAFETKMLPPEEAAKQIVAGISRNAPRVLITREATFIDKVSRASPRLTARLVARAYKRTKDRMNARG